jgi:predicted MPP superfamily phosphohydrolase
MLRWSLRALLLAAALLAVWALLIEPSRLVVHREELRLPHWPKPLAGLRVALLSDLHVGSPHWGVERLQALVAETNAERPELVLLAGDFVHGVPLGSDPVPELLAEALGELKAPLGVVAVLGNHDWWFDGQRMESALRAHGLIVLDNDLHTVARGGGALTVVGLADAMTRPQRVRETIDRAPPGDALLVLVHEPDVFPEIDARPSLTLAGHTHGGQVDLPILGRIWVPSRFGQRYAAGHIVEEGRHLFVTTGVGTSILPVRFRVPPELVMLTLR